LELSTGVKKKYKKLDRKTRKMLTIHGQHHSKATLIAYMFPEKREEKD
jgi:hypothetical protein